MLNKNANIFGNWYLMFLKLKKQLFVSYLLWGNFQEITLLGMWSNAVIPLIRVRPVCTSVMESRTLVQTPLLSYVTITLLSYLYSGTVPERQRPLTKYVLT